jgi:hypothetical protein
MKVRKKIKIIKSGVIDTAVKMQEIHFKSPETGSSADNAVRDWIREHQAKKQLAEKAARGLHNRAVEENRKQAS